MKGFFRTLIIFFCCLGVIRVGLGASGELHLEVILEYLEDNAYGTDHIRDTIVHFSEIQSELDQYKESLKSEDGADLRDEMTFQERFQTTIDQILIYGKFIVNSVVLLYRVVELLITEIIYLLRIAAYLLFGVAM